MIDTPIGIITRVYSYLSLAKIKKKKLFCINNPFLRNAKDCFSISKVRTIHKFCNPRISLSFSQVNPCLAIMCKEAICKVVLISWYREIKEQLPWAVLYRYLSYLFKAKLSFKQRNKKI